MTYFDKSPPIARRISTKSHWRPGHGKLREKEGNNSQGRSTGGGLPGKLADLLGARPGIDRALHCRGATPAGGSAKQGRDRRYQSDLPIRGFMGGGGLESNVEKRAKINF